MKEMILPDNISICSECGEKTDDKYTKWSDDADPYCEDCYKKEVVNKMEYKDLSEAHKKKVFDDWKFFINEMTFECHVHCKTIEDFWENHKEMDYPYMLGNAKK